MNANDYQQDALRTEEGLDYDCSALGLIHGLMGLNGEAGECIDIYKKYLFQGHELDKRHLALELGDVAWYLAVSAAHLGYDLETIFKMNIEKRNARYPNGFDSNRSKYRKNYDI